METKLHQICEKALDRKDISVWLDVMSDVCEKENIDFLDEVLEIAFKKYNTEDVLSKVNYHSGSVVIDTENVQDKYTLSDFLKKHFGLSKYAKQYQLQLF
jgi:O-phosphoseryl-tRNA(Cys) synthetase